MYLSKIVALDPGSKRTLKIPRIAKRLDSDRIIYPRGVLTTLRPSKDAASSTVKRIEVFAEDSRETYGILRTIFVAYSSERLLLDMAQASDNVVQIHSVSSASSKKDDRGRRIVEDLLVLKRAEPPPSVEIEGPHYTMRPPELHVSEYWLQRTELGRGDKIMISNPMENFLVPPPTLQANA